MQAVLLKIKSGKEEVWKNWCHDLTTTLRDQAVLTLKEEGVLQELTLSFSLNGERYVVGYVDGECLPANMDREINQKHALMKEVCLERVGDIDVLYNIKSE